MQVGNIEYKNLIEDIIEFFTLQIQIAHKAGITDKQFMIDPGIGFGKTVNQNIEIINKLHEFKIFNLPIVFGTSRKKHLGKILQEELNLTDIPTSTERIEAALAETALACIYGAQIIRTHDVLQTKKFVATLDRILQ